MLSLFSPKLLWRIYRDADSHPFLPRDLLFCDEATDTAEERLILNEIHKIKEEPCDWGEEKKISMIPGIAVGEDL